MELPLKELVRRDGRLYQVSGAGPFTGIVTDAYEGGELKSRSVVTNGLLEGLSRGWHPRRPSDPCRMGHPRLPWETVIIL